MKPTTTLASRLFNLWQLFSRLWQAGTPWLRTKGSCRFTPTCSQFARQAVSRYGMILGVWITLKRISKCHPFSQGGFDPVEYYR
jgi:hypothetical protein